MNKLPISHKDVINLKPEEMAKCKMSKNNIKFLNVDEKIEPSQIAMNQLVSNTKFVKCAIVSANIVE